EEEGAIGIGELVMAGLILGMGASMASKQLAHVNVANDIDQILDGLIATGTTAAISAYGRFAAQPDVLQRAISRTEGRARAAGRVVAYQFGKPKIFPVIKSLGKDVYKLDVDALKANPAWYVLNYLGPGNKEIVAEHRRAAFRNWG